MQSPKSPRKLHDEILYGVNRSLSLCIDDCRPLPCSVLAFVVICRRGSQRENRRLHLGKNVRHFHSAFFRFFPHLTCAFQGRRRRTRRSAPRPRHVHLRIEVLPPVRSGEKAHGSIPCVTYPVHLNQRWFDPLLLLFQKRQCPPYTAPPTSLCTCGDQIGPL